MGCAPCEAARRRVLEGMKQAAPSEVVGGLTDGAKVLLAKAFGTTEVFTEPNASSTVVFNPVDDGKTEKTP